MRAREREREGRENHIDKWRKRQGVDICTIAGVQFAVEGKETMHVL